MRVHMFGRSKTSKCQGDLGSGRRVDPKGSDGRGSVLLRLRTMGFINERPDYVKPRK